MATQQALLVTKVGSPVELTSSHPIPEPSAIQVQIKVTVAGINPHDAKARDWGLFVAGHLPAVLTNDVTGVVTKVGSSVTKFSVGDRVLTQPDFVPGYTQNGLQQYSVADADFSIKIPDSISNDQAATLPTNIIAPLVALFDESTLHIPAPWTEAAKSFDYKNTTLLVVGGGSSCGKFGVQLAKLAGIGKIVVVGGPEDELKGYGATDVLSRHGGYDAVLERIRSVVGDDLVYAYDAINPPDELHITVNALSNTKKGKVARLLPNKPFEGSKVVGKNAGYEVKDTYGSSQAKPVTSKPFWDHLPEYLTSGAIKPLNFKVEKGLDADKINKLLDDYTAGRPTTKTHFHISE